MDGRSGAGSKERGWEGEGAKGGKDGGGWQKTFFFS